MEAKPADQFCRNSFLNKNNIKMYFSSAHKDSPFKIVSEKLTGTLLLVAYMPIYRFPNKSPRIGTECCISASYSPSLGFALLK